MLVISQSLFARFVEAAVLAVPRRVDTFPIWLASWVKPPQPLLWSPLMATSKEVYSPHFVLVM